jgi:hypothetical protein
VKIDTTRVEITGKQLDKLVSAISQHPSGFSSGEITILIAASIAALTTILIFFLTQQKEKRSLKKELIADERRIAFLITAYYKDLVRHLVNMQYWYRASAIFESTTEEHKLSTENHFISSEKRFETTNRISLATSEYFKVVTHFTITFGENKSINNVLKDIKQFKPRKASQFSEVQEYEQLRRTAEIEDEELNKVYLYYSDCFDKINSVMK